LRARAKARRRDQALEAAVIACGDRGQHGRFVGLDRAHDCIHGAALREPSRLPSVPRAEVAEVAARDETRMLEPTERDLADRSCELASPAGREVADQDRYDPELAPELTSRGLQEREILAPRVVGRELGGVAFEREPLCESRRELAVAGRRPQRRVN